jgi:hypothetical protein
MSLASYIRATDGIEALPRLHKKKPFLDPAVDTPSIGGSGNIARSLTAGLLEVAGPGFEPGHHDFQLFSEALRYAENTRKYADFCPRSTTGYQLVLSLLLRYC